MKAKISGIDPLKSSRTEFSFRRIYFLLEDGKWAKTDIVLKYRNYHTWKPIIETFESGEEVFLEGIILRQEGEVDADSPVRITPVGFEVIKTPEKKKMIQEKLI